MVPGLLLIRILSSILFKIDFIWLVYKESFWIFREIFLIIEKNSKGQNINKLVAIKKRVIIFDFSILLKFSFKKYRILGRI